MDCTPPKQRQSYCFDVFYACLFVISSISCNRAENGGGKPFYYQDENGRVMEVRRTGFTLPPVKRQCECYCLIAGDEATIHCCVECHVTDSVCFPATAHVTNRNGDVIRMSDLKVGDTILTVSDSSEIEETKVLGFLTYNRDIIGGYVKATVESGSSILLSRSHLIYVSDTNSSLDATPRYAGTLRPGQYLTLRQQDKVIKEQVVYVGKEAHQGAYVPLTTHGTLLVNDVRVSSYAAFPHHVAHAFMAPLRWAPILASYVTPSNGDHPYVTFLKALGDVIMPDRRYRSARSDRSKSIDQRTDIDYGSAVNDVTPEMATSDARET